MRKPRINVSCAYVTKDGKRFGVLDKMLMSMDEVQHWLKILSPFESLRWNAQMEMLNRKGFAAIEINTPEMVKVIKLERN